VTLAAILPAPLAACAPAQDPPGRTVELALPELHLKLPAVGVEQAPRPQEDDDTRDANEPGHGDKIASIAMRTWIYVEPRDRSTKLGYLRAGAVVDRAHASAGTEGCAGGWYRIVPRGYVCVGKGASLSLEHQVIEAALRGPDRSALLPYHYAISRSPPPHLYFRLPTRADQERVEGRTLGRELARLSALEFPFEADPVPDFLAQGRDLPKPYGAEEKLHYSVHTGRAREAAAFGLITTFEWTGRRFGLTTELDLIPLDRTRAAKPSKFAGTALEAPGAPAIVMGQGVTKLREDELGKLREDGTAPYRSGWALTGKRKGGMAETTEGSWLPVEALRIAELREDPRGYAASGKKWIDISIEKQMLVAYEGKRPVFVTLVSTGRGEMGDPEKTQATVRGTFLIHAKHVSATMDGDEATDSYDLRDVPYIQYFHEGYALHGAFWHDEFGKARSHGCVNLSPTDARWLFEWTDPVVPPEWHGAVNAEGGTLIYTHR